MNSKNSEKEINLNKENNHKQQIKNNKNKIKENNEIIIELEIKISNKEKGKEIYILCNKEQIIKDNKNKLKTKIFDYFNENNTKLYLNDEEIQFNYKINFNKLELIK